MSSAKGQAKQQPAAASSPKEQTPKAIPKEKASSPAPAALKQVNGKDKSSAAKEASPLPSTPSTPTAKAPKQPVKESTPEPERNPDEKLNPFVEVIAKRLRALKKRLTKIEKNEELQAQGQKLDQDQLKSVAQKTEVVHLITELEDIAKNFQEVLLEEEKLERAEKKRLALEEQKKIAALKEQQQQEFKKTLEPIYVLNVFAEEDVRTLLTTQGIEGFLLSQQELQTLDAAASAVYGKYQASQGLEESSKRFFSRVKKLSSKNSENLAPGLTYTSVQTLLSKISASPFFVPELAAKLAKERAEREAAEEAARREQEEMHNSYEIIQPEEIPPFAPMSPEQMNGLPGGAPLAFIGESEVLGVQPVVSFDGSPAVVVPIPQTLFYAQIATPLYSPFRPTPQPVSHHPHPHHHQQPVASPAPVVTSQQPLPSSSSSSSAPSSSSSSSSQDQSPQPSPQASSQPVSIAADQHQQPRFNQSPRGGRGGHRNNYGGAPSPNYERKFQQDGQQRPPQHVPRSDRGGASNGAPRGRGGYSGPRAPPQSA